MRLASTQRREDAKTQRINQVRGNCSSRFLSFAPLSLRVFALSRIHLKSAITSFQFDDEQVVTHLPEQEAVYFSGEKHSFSTTLLKRAEVVFDQWADDVSDGNVNFLYAWGYCVGNNQWQIN